MKTNKRKKTTIRNLLQKTVIVALTLFSFSIEKTKATCNAGFTYSVTSGNLTTPPNTILFTNTSTGGGTHTKYVWTFEDGNSSVQYETSSKTPFSHTFTADPYFSPDGGYYYYAYLEMHDSTTNCASGTSDTILVKTFSSTCNSSFTYYPDSLNKNKVYFHNTSTSVSTNLSYQWYFGDGSTSTDENPVHTFNTTSQHVFYTYLIITGDSDCYSTSYQVIHVNDSQQEGCQANFNSQVYATGNVYFFNASTSSATTLNYLWNFGDGSTSTEQNPHHFYATSVPQYYSACLTIWSNDTTCNSSFCDTIYVNTTDTNITHCQAYFVIHPDSFDNTLYIGRNLSQAGPYATFTWNWGDGSSSTGAYPRHDYQNPGSYMICLTVTDIQDSCQSEFCDTVGIYKKEGTMRSIEIIQEAGQTLGVKDNAAGISNMTIAPNPFSSSTNISYSLNENANVKIAVRDLMGRQIVLLENTNKPSGKYSTIFDGSSLTKGIYLLELNINGNLSTKKIVLSAGE